MQRNTSTVVVLGTGGTIAGTSATPGDDLHYTAGQLSVVQLLAAVPDVLHGVARPVECEQVAQIDSKDMTHAVWLALAQRVAHHLQRPEVAGVVVTHGSDTLDETAYFLHRVVSASKPVVLTAAMRPATAAQPDGPGNLADALLVARHPGAQGVLAVVAGAVHGAELVRKVHPTRLDAFGSGEAGPVARVHGGRLHLLREWPVAEAAPCALWPDVLSWPQVELVSSHAGASGAVVQALVAAGVQGLVVEGTGNASVHVVMEEALLAAQQRGVAVLRASRCGEGPVLAKSCDALPSAGALTPAKARIALMLQLMKTV
jgi:L-asparaginase